MDAAPLAGIRILDFSQYLPGPYATRLLCDLGAQVIKVEPPHGDPLRSMFGGTLDCDSAVYRLLNRGKIIARLNLKECATRNALLPVIAEADVLLESFRPGVLERLGLSYQALYPLNHRLVYCSLSGYGQDGPMGLVGGHDINYGAAAGLFSYGKASTPYPLIADHSGAVNAVNAIMAALLGRNRHGQGSYIDVSLYESVLTYQYLAMTGAPDNQPDLEILTGSAACYNFYHTLDHRTITLGALEPTFWRNFCTAMNKPEWVSRQFEAVPQSDLISEVSEVIGNLTLAHLMDILAGVDCCFEPVPKPDEIHCHRQTQSRQLLARDQLAYPARINNSQPISEYTTQDLPVNDLPSWTI